MRYNDNKPSNFNLKEMLEITTIESTTLTANNELYKSIITELPTQLAGIITETATDALPFTRSSTSEMVEMVYQMILFGVGIPINIIAFVKFSKHSKSLSEMRLMRLSRQLLIAHLMVLWIYCVWRTYWIYSVTWTLGDLLCKVYSFLSALPFHLWSNIVAAVAGDMLYCVHMPLKSVQNANSRVTWLIGISWLAAILCSTPMVLFRGVVRIPGTKFEQCYALVDDFDEQTLVMFNVFHVLTTFYVPVLIVIACYVTIGLKLRIQMAERKLLGDDNRRSHNINSRFIFGTVCIVCSFIIAWLPYQVMALLRVICMPNSSCEKFVTKFNWLQAILIASTCLNPFLYKFGIFRSARRNPSCGYYTYHSQIGGESNAGLMAKASISGIRNDFRQSMRSLGPHCTNVITNSYSNGTIASSEMRCHGGSIRAGFTTVNSTMNSHPASDATRLRPQLSSNAITVSVDFSRNADKFGDNASLALRRKLQNAYRTITPTITADTLSTRCQSTTTPPYSITSSSVTQPLLLEDEDINISGSITENINIPVERNDDLVNATRSEPCLLIQQKSGTESSLNSVSLLDVSEDKSKPNKQCVSESLISNPKSNSSIQSPDIDSIMDTGFMKHISNIVDVKKDSIKADKCLDEKILSPSLACSS